MSQSERLYLIYNFGRNQKVRNAEDKGVLNTEQSSLEVELYLERQIRLKIVNKKGVRAKTKAHGLT